jgi:hypothetical protein
MKQNPENFDELRQKCREAVEKAYQEEHSEVNREK